MGMHLFRFSLCYSLLAVSALAGARYDYPGHFGPATRWTGPFCLAGETPGVGDFNGDGYDDVVSFLRSSRPSEVGWVYVALNDQSGGLGGASTWNRYFSINNEIPMTGDFNGDGKDDVVTFLPGGGVFVAVSDGTAFVDSRNWYATGAFSYAGETPLVGDFNGDGRADIATVTSSSVWVSLSNGTSFATQTRWTADFQSGVPRVGDVNGDKRADLVCFARDSRAGSLGRNVEVALSNGTNAFTYGALRYWNYYFAQDATYDPHLADLNGDGAMDIVSVRDDGAMFASIAHPAGTFGSGNGGTNTGDPFWQWHRDVRNPGKCR
jgi:hypothetical protein